MLRGMIHWLNSKRTSWLWDRKPSPAMLTSEDFLVLAALDQEVAREADLLSPHHSPALPPDAIQASLARLVQHGLARRLLKGSHVRYKLSRHGAHMLANSKTKS